MRLRRRVLGLAFRLVRSVVSPFRTSTKRPRGTTTFFLLPQERARTWRGDGGGSIIPSMPSPPPPPPPMCASPGMPPPPPLPPSSRRLPAAAAGPPDPPQEGRHRPARGRHHRRGASSGRRRQARSVRPVPAPAPAPAAVRRPASQGQVPPQERPHVGPSRGRSQGPLLLRLVVLLPPPGQGAGVGGAHHPDAPDVPELGLAVGADLPYRDAVLVGLVLPTPATNAVLTSIEGGRNKASKSCGAQ